VSTAITPQLIQKLQGIKALVLDCDGVLTDTKIYYMGQGQWSRSFSIRDGFGIKKLQNAGIQVAIITTSKSEDITERAKSLKIDHLYDGAHDKIPAWDQLLKKLNLQSHEVAYMGDDEPDLPLLAKAGVSISVVDAIEHVRSIVDYVAQQPAGRGAVREVCELILKYRKI
jgi:3-deoxy-D-manno-octulosonate 8-phosphate phosphatase (KDO 8-P phosphatase)